MNINACFAECEKRIKLLSMSKHKKSFKVKIISWVLMLLLVSSCLFSACVPKGKTELDDTAKKSDDLRLNVVTTLFPYYDFLRQIAGDSIRLTLVVPAGMDSHSFEPTPADMITIQNADLLVCNGGTMEQWLTQVLDSFEEGNGPKRVVTMMDYVDVVQEEIVEGMEDEEHDHGEDEHSDEHSDDDDGHGEEIEYDEHIWTSPVNASKLVGVLTEVLTEESPENAELFAQNCSSYQNELAELDAEFREIVSHAKRHMVVFGDKFPLRYFFDEYGLEYRAAFSGCSTDTEPSAKTIAYLIDKVRNEQIPAVYYLELSSPRVAEIIGEETGVKSLLFNSCHNVTRSQFDAGVTYLELMHQNAENLKKGLY